MPPVPRENTLRQLRQQLDRLSRQQQPISSEPVSGKPIPSEVVSTGLGPLDQLLPSGGIGRGTLLEWLSSGVGSGAVTLALQIVRRGLELFPKGGFVVVDAEGDFYPLAAAALGIDLDRMILVRPRKQDVAWAFEQALRCPAVAVSLCWAGRTGLGETIAKSSGTRASSTGVGPRAAGPRAAGARVAGARVAGANTRGASDRVLRRWQLAAERGQGFGFYLGPASARKQPSWGTARFLVRPIPGSFWTRRVVVELLSCRGRISGGAFALEIDDETGLVHPISTLASAAALAEDP